MFRKNRYIIEFALLYLYQTNSYGFELTKKLNKINKVAKIDTAGVYRALDKLEKEKLVTFKWVKGDGGPNKKLYSITKEGSDYLEEFHIDAKKTKLALTIFTDTYQAIKNK